jgi:hypothetical protein
MSAAMSSVAFHGNESGITLARALVSSYAIYQEPHWPAPDGDGSIQWYSTSASNLWQNSPTTRAMGWSFQQSTPSQPAVLSTVACNPVFMAPTEWSQLYGQGSLPDLSTCNTLNRNFDSDVSFVTAVNDFTNNQYWAQIRATNSLPPTNVPITATSGLVGHAISAKITLPPPNPKCWLQAVPGTVSGGQSVTLTLTTLASVAATGNTWEDGSAAPQKGGTRVVTPPDNTFFATPFTYSATVQGPPGTNPFTCSAQVMVQSPCRFSDRAYSEPLLWGIFGSGVGSVVQAGGQYVVWGVPEVIDLGPGTGTYWCTAAEICWWHYLLLPDGEYQSFNGALENPMSADCYPALKFARADGCFVGTVQIKLAGGTTKPASRIDTGDWLWNPLRRLPVRVAKVVVGPEKQPVVELRGKGFSLEVTETHPFPTTSGLRQARELRIGDRVIDGAGRPVSIEAIRRPFLPPGDLVYNFELDTPSPEWEDRVIEANGIATGDLHLQNFLEKKGREIE